MSLHSTKPGGHWNGVEQSAKDTAQVPSAQVTCVEGHCPEEVRKAAPCAVGEMHRWSVVATKPGGQTSDEGQVMGDSGEQEPSLQRTGRSAGQGRRTKHSSADLRQTPFSQRTVPAGQSGAEGQRS